MELENIFSLEPPHILEMCPNFVNSYLKKRKSILLDFEKTKLCTFSSTTVGIQLKCYLSSIDIMLFWCFKLGIKYDIKTWAWAFFASIYIEPKPRYLYISKYVGKLFWFLPKSSTNIHECILHISLPKTRDIRTYSVLRSCKQEMQTSLMNVPIFKLLSLFCVFFLHVIYYGEMSVLIVSPFVTWPHWPFLIWCMTTWEDPPSQCNAMVGFS